MRLTPAQLDILSKYFADVSKLLVASVVIGFFVPFEGKSLVSVSDFIVGSLVAILFLLWGVRLGKHTKL